MSLMNQITTSIRSYYKALTFISENKLWSWFFLPGLINLALFIIIGILAWSYSENTTIYMVDFFNIDNETGTSFLFWTSLILIRTLVLFIFFFVYKYIILILMSPALALFAEKLYTIQTGESAAFNPKVFINNIFRGVGLAIKNLLKELILTGLILLLAFTGFFAPLIPILIFIVQSYYYGFSMLDYRNELEDLNISDSSKMVWQNKGVAIGNGAVFNLLLFIPFFGALVAPMLALTATFITIENKKG